MEQKKKVSFKKWWQDARPTKTVVFWACVASVVLTIIVGFAWGGWVTDGTAQKIADQRARDAVIERLAPICVAQFNQDPEKVQKLEELKNASTYQRRTYLQDQGWADMPGEQGADRGVEDECIKQLMLIE